MAQITKMGLLFLLDRETGQPIYGVEERPVPASDVPGEAAWPTQPFPLKPAPLARTSMTRAEVSKRTPEVERYCTELFDSLVGRSLYSPFGTQKTLSFPGAMGGGNWGGVSFDPRLGYVFVNTSNLGAIGHMVPADAGAPVAVSQRERLHALPRSGALSLPAAALGRADRGGRQHRRHRVEGAARVVSGARGAGAEERGARRTSAGPSPPPAG